MSWEANAGAATADITAALDTDEPAEALSHLREAAVSPDLAIEELEEVEEEKQGEAEER